MKVLVIGGEGQLGQALRWSFTQLTCPYANRMQAQFTKHTDVDLNAEDLFYQLNQYQPDVVINCAAYNNVDAAEHDFDAAFAINATGPKRLAQWCMLHGCHLIHISTDYVFDGVHSSPYMETDSPRPLSKYGQSKLVGEQFVLNECPQATVIRTAWLYSVWGRNFLTVMEQRLLQQHSLSIVDDQLGSPTWAGALAIVIWYVTYQRYFVVDKASDNFAGLFHYAGAGQCSWYDLVCAIRDAIADFGSFKLTSHKRICPISTSEYVASIAPNSAVRPTFSALASDKLQHLLPFAPIWLWDDWRHQLQRCFENRDKHQRPQP